LCYFQALYARVTLATLTNYRSNYSLNGLIWGLCGALLIGGSDCIARVTAQRISSSVLFLFIMGLAFICLTVWLAITADWPPWHAKAWTASAISGLLNLVALYFLYIALARGPVAIASPAASTFTVILVFLNIISGEAWSWLQVGAMCIVFIGVCMLAQPSAADKNVEHYDTKWLRKTAMYALGAAAAVSIRMFLAQEAGSELGPLHALYLNRLFALVGAIALIGYCLARMQTIVWPSGRMLHLVVVQAAFETAALGSFLIGSQDGGRIAATVGFSAFAAATAFFAWIWLGERIGLKRGVWIAVVAVGVSLASIASP